MYVCICNAVTDREIRQCAGLGALTIDEVRDALGVATRCAQCVKAIEQILCEYDSPPQANPLRNALSLSEDVPTQARARSLSKLF